MLDARFDLFFQRFNTFAQCFDLARYTAVGVRQALLFSHDLIQRVRHLGQAVLLSFDLPARFADGTLFFLHAAALLVGKFFDDRLIGGQFHHRRADLFNGQVVDAFKVPIQSFLFLR